MLGMEGEGGLRRTDQIVEELLQMERSLTNFLLSRGGKFQKGEGSELCLQ